MSSRERRQILLRAQKSLNSIRPYLRTDGGDIEVVDLTDDYVLQVKLLGACETCSVSYMTMKAGVEEILKKDIPELNAVVALNVEVA